MTFLEFFEALLLCAKLWYSNLSNSELGNPAIATGSPESLPPQDLTSVEQTQDVAAVELSVEEVSQEKDGEQVTVVSPPSPQAIETGQPEQGMG